MGWCSATAVFDNVAKYILKSDLTNEDKQDCLMALANALEEEDWDCQSDSAYRDHPIVRSIMKELHPKWNWEDVEDNADVS